VQSFDDRRLHLIGRKHDAALAYSAVRQARDAGFADINVNGRIDVSDEHDVLAGEILRSAYWLPQWPIRMWFGGFDSDALCGYTRGTLDIPFVPRVRVGGSIRPRALLA
jgi:hypothetical protein